MSREKHQPVIDVLNDVLAIELTAINQYFLHAKMFQNWGYERLYAKEYEASIVAMRHADKLIERILFLDGLPNLQKLLKLRVGETVQESIECDLALETDALPRLREGVVLCRQLHDEGSRLILEAILAAEEAYIDWLEAQTDQMAQIGVENWLSHQIRADEG